MRLKIIVRQQKKLSVSNGSNVTTGASTSTNVGGASMDDEKDVSPCELENSNQDRIQSWAMRILCYGRAMEKHLHWMRVYVLRHAIGKRNTVVTYMNVLRRKGFQWGDAITLWKFVDAANRARRNWSNISVENQLTILAIRAHLVCGYFCDILWSKKKSERKNQKMATFWWKKNY